MLDIPFLTAENGLTLDYQEPKAELKMISFHFLWGFPSVIVQP
jgi:hypothetical protein